MQIGHLLKNWQWRVVESLILRLGETAYLLGNGNTSTLTTSRAVTRVQPVVAPKVAIQKYVFSCDTL
jgi:hypothetical protein